MCPSSSTTSRCKCDAGPELPQDQGNRETQANRPYPRKRQQFGGEIGGIALSRTPRADSWLLRLFRHHSGVPWPLEQAEWRLRCRLLQRPAEMPARDSDRLKRGSSFFTMPHVQMHFYLICAICGFFLPTVMVLSVLQASTCQATSRTAAASISALEDFPHASTWSRCVQRMGSAHSRK